MWDVWDALLTTLAVFVEFLAAGKEGKLNSEVGLWGIARKVMIFAIVVLAHMLDQQLGDGHMFRDGTVAFYLANEALSIIENSGRIGLPIPPKVKQAVEILRGKGDDHE